LPLFSQQVNDSRHTLFRLAYDNYILIWTSLFVGAKASSYASTLEKRGPLQYASRKLKVVGKEHIKDWKRSWVAKKCCRRFGVYVPKQGIEAQIVGGPQAVYKAEDGTEIIDADVVMYEFDIVIADPTTAKNNDLAPPLPPRQQSIHRLSDTSNHVSINSLKKQYPE
jgi:hypothetical protein